MKTKLNILQGKFLAKVRGYTKMPKGYYLGKLLDEGGEPTMEEMVEVGKMITNFYVNKTKELEEKTKPIKQKEFKDFILEKIDEEFLKQKNEELDESVVGTEFKMDLVEIKVIGYWEKGTWYDYEIKFGDENINGTKYF